MTILYFLAKRRSSQSNNSGQVAQCSTCSAKSNSIFFLRLKRTFGLSVKISIPETTIVEQEESRRLTPLTSTKQTRQLALIFRSG